MWLSLYVWTSYASWPFLFGTVLVIRGSWLCLFGVSIIITFAAAYRKDPMYCCYWLCAVVIENSTDYLPHVKSGCPCSFSGYTPALRLRYFQDIFPVYLKVDKTRMSHTDNTHTCMCISLFAHTCIHTYLSTCISNGLWWKCAETVKLLILGVSGMYNSSSSINWFWNPGYW